MKMNLMLQVENTPKNQTTAVRAMGHVACGAEHMAAI